MNIKFWTIFTFLTGLLASCSNKNLEISSETSKVISPTPSIPKPQQPLEAKSEKIYPWLYKVGFEKIDPNLVAEGEKLQVSYIREYESSPNNFCVFDVKYPQISGLKDLAIQERINYKLWVAITKIAYKDFQKLLQEEPRYNDCQAEVTKSEVFSDLTLQQFKERYRRRISIDRPCQIKYAKKSLVSLICAEWRMPGAYPLIYGRGATFNLRNGEFYDTPWKPNLDYIEPYFYEVVRDKASEKIINILPIKGKKIPIWGYLKAGNDFYLADECQNLEETSPPSVAQKNLFNSTCIIFVNVGSGSARHASMSITTDEVAAVLREEIAEITNTEPLK